MEDTRAQLRQLLKAFQDANDPVLMKEFREAFGASGATQKPVRNRRRTTSEQARNIVMAGGEAIYDEERLPVPPEHVVEAGQAAIDLWHDGWRRGFQPGELGGFNDDMLQDLQPDSAVEAIPGR